MIIHKAKGGQQPRPPPYPKVQPPLSCSHQVGPSAGQDVPNPAPIPQVPGTGPSKSLRMS